MIAPCRECSKHKSGEEMLRIRPLLLSKIAPCFQRNTDAHSQENHGSGLFPGLKQKTYSSAALPFTIGR